MAEMSVRTLKAFRDGGGYPSLYQALSDSIDQDRLERPFCDDAQVEEGPCSNPHAGCQKRIDVLEMDLKLAQAALEKKSENRENDRHGARDRAYVAIEALKIEFWSPDVERVRVAATKALLEFLGQGDEAPEEEDDPDFADIEPAPKPPAEPYPWPDEKKPRPYQDDQGY